VIDPKGERNSWPRKMSPGVPGGKHPDNDPQPKGEEQRHDDEGLRRPISIHPGASFPIEP
jgi:hypothetical protein